MSLSQNKTICSDKIKTLQIAWRQLKTQYFSIPDIQELSFKDRAQIESYVSHFVNNEIGHYIFKNHDLLQEIQYVSLYVCQEYVILDFWSKETCYQNQIW